MDSRTLHKTVLGTHSLFAVDSILFLFILRKRPNFVWYQGCTRTIKNVCISMYCPSKLFSFVCYVPAVRATKKMSAPLCEVSRELQMVKMLHSLFNFASVTICTVLYCILISICFVFSYKEEEDDLNHCMNSSCTQSMCLLCHFA